MDGVTRYPLTWPVGWKRTTRRVGSPFSTKRYAQAGNYKQAAPLTIAFADRYPDAGLKFAMTPLAEFARSPVVERKRKAKVQPPERFAGAAAGREA